MDAPYTLSTDVFWVGGGYMSEKNMLPQIVFYRHISPFFYTVSAEVGVAWEHAVANCFLQTYISLFLYSQC